MRILTIHPHKVSEIFKDKYIFAIYRHNLQTALFYNYLA
jgi:hypothetical protein